MILPEPKTHCVASFQATPTILLLLLLASLIACEPFRSVSFQPKANFTTEAAGSNPRTKYLLHQAWTYITPSSKAPAGAPTGLQSKEQLAAGIDSLLSAIGERGDHVTTQIGFVSGPITWDETDTEIRQQIRDGFAVAEEKDVAVGFHIDDSMFWINRTSLWSDPDNVEWSDWNKTVVPHRIIGWFADGAPDLAPPMCYTSPVIVAEATRLASDVIGPEIKKGVDHLAAIGKQHLFAGVIAGWETRMQDDNFDASSSSNRFFGYCALHHMGYSASNPPADMNKELEKVVHKWIELWARHLNEAGIPKNKLFTHVAFPTQQAPAELPQNIRMGLFKNVDPLSTAFNEFSNPGFSAYGTTFFAADSPLVKAMKPRSDRPWGVSEGTAINLLDTYNGGAGSGDSMESYLAGVFNHGGVYVNLFGFWDGNASPLGQNTSNPAAIDAFRKFLRGEPLLEDGD